MAWRCRAWDGFYGKTTWRVLQSGTRALVYKELDEDPEEEEFEEEKDPQEEEDDMKIDIEEDENEPELTYPYEEVDPLNFSSPAFESEPDDEIEVENLIEHEDKTDPASVYKVGESSAAPFLQEDSDSLLPGLMRRDINSLFGWMDSISRQLCGRETEHALVEMKGKAKDKFYGKLILELGNEVRSSVEHGTAAMEKLVEKLGNSEDKDSVDDAIAAEQARQTNVRNDASGFGPVMGQDAAPAVRECTFAGFMKCNPTVFRGVEGAVKLRRWFEKTESVFEISECVEGKKVKFTAATLKGPALTWWKTKVATMGLETINQMPWTEMKQLMTAEFCLIKEVQIMKHELWNLKVKEYDGEVTFSKPADLNKAVRMAHKLMEQKSQARDARILEGKKRKWESLQGGNSSAMVTTPTDGKLPLCERCFSRHVGQCTIKCHKCGKVGHKVRYFKEKSVATGANSQPIWACYDCGEQGHTRNQCTKKVKQEEVGEAPGRAYVIKDAKPQGPNVITGMFLLNNHYAFVLFDLGSNRSFLDTRFIAMLDIDLIKIRASYEVELADGMVASTNTILKGCTLNLVNHIFKIDLMPIELGTFDVIIGMDWIVKQDAIIVCGEKVVRIQYGNEMLIVKSDKGVSRLKVISCIKAHKYVERGCHLFLAHVTESKSKEKRMEDVPVIRDFPEVFPEEFPGLPPSRQVEFRVDLVRRAAPVARAPHRLAPSEMKEL
nr:hypothetical protein [Tanacetum cinerariifolium]